MPSSLGATGNQPPASGAVGMSADPRGRARCVADDTAHCRISRSLAEGAQLAGLELQVIPERGQKRLASNSPMTRADGNSDGNDGNHRHAGTDAGSSTRSDFSPDQAIRYT